MALLANQRSQVIDAIVKGFCGGCCIYCRAFAWVSRVLFRQPAPIGLDPRHTGIGRSVQSFSIAT